MHPKIITSALVLALAAQAAPALAQNQGAQNQGAQNQPAGQAAPAPAAAPARYSVDTKFSVLMADPNAAKVVREFFRKRRQAAGEPDQTPDEEAQTMQMVADMSPRDVAVYPQAHLDDAGLVELDAQLAQVPYPAQAQTTPTKG